jgi:hypothetical protein
MHPLNRRYLLLSAISGAAWGLIAYAITRSVFPGLILPAVLLSPFVGLVIGIGFRWIHELKGAGSRAIVALVSLYAAAALFGIIIGMTDLARDLDLPPGTRRLPWAVVIQPVMAIWYGLTLGWFVLLWPVTWLNHRMLGRAL